ncbi:hypothetical protein [Methanobacterium sp. MBAC-LM]|uniref:hypothetical protein n=1 Tax=Methanobacterium sp. MBAC-LM TaxID=3412034 RepID=UPI003C74C1DE
MESETFNTLAQHYEILSKNNLIYYMYVAYDIQGYDKVPKNIKERIKEFIFSKKIRKNIHNKKKYDAHHLLPKSLFPYGKYDLDNGIPLNYELHSCLHEEYNNQELLLNSVMPIVKVLETSFLNSK